MHPAITSKITRYRILFVMAFLVFAIDQATKAWIFYNLDLDSYYPPDSITVISDFFYIVHIGNEGAAWGMLSGYGGSLAIFAMIALIAIYLMRHTLELHRKSMQYVFGLLTGGIMGNMTDRLVHGHVIDFLDFHLPFTIPWLIPTGRYPSFNIADCGIVVGTILYLILSFKIEAVKRELKEP